MTSRLSRFAEPGAIARREITEPGYAVFEKQVGIFCERPYGEFHFLNLANSILAENLKTLEERQMMARLFGELIKMVNHPPTSKDLEEPNNA